MRKLGLFLLLLMVPFFYLGCRYAERHRKTLTMVHRSGQRLIQLGP